MLRLATSTLLLTLLASACATSPDVYVDQDPAADFAAYRTYAFEAQLGTDREDGTPSILSTHLKTAISRELDARGYRASGVPDLHVNAYIETEEKLRTDPAPTAGYGGYYGYRRGHYGAWGGYGHQTRVESYTEGTLTIDLVEVGRDQLVWEGTVVGRVTKKVRGNLRASVDRAVAEIFARYPYRALPDAADDGTGDACPGE